MIKTAKRAYRRPTVRTWHYARVS